MFTYLIRLVLGVQEAIKQGLVGTAFLILEWPVEKSGVTLVDAIEVSNPQVKGHCRNQKLELVVGESWPLVSGFVSYFKPVSLNSLGAQSPLQKCKHFFVAIHTG